MLLKSLLLRNTLHIFEIECKVIKKKLNYQTFPIIFYIYPVKTGKKAVLKINFLPECTVDEVKELLHQRKKDCPYKNEKELLTGLFPEKLINVLTSQKNLISAITEYTLEVTDGLSFSQAQVCSGGVDTSEIVNETMESRFCPNVYIVGELLDIDGTCGGYNLQWAWSSGAAAGIHAAKEYKR